MFAAHLRALVSLVSDRQIPPGRLLLHEAVTGVGEKGLSAANLLGLNIRTAFYHWRNEHDECDRILDWALGKAHDIGDVPRILQNHFVPSGS